MLASMMARFLAGVAMALAASAGLAYAQTGSRATPVVVELYTSQGCLQCPRANRLLGQFAAEPDTLALTFAVGYWDYLGWRDTFAQVPFMDRQRDFSRAMRVRGLLTPQLVFNGVRQISAADWDSARAILTDIQASPPPSGAPNVTLQRLPNRRTRIAIAGGAPPPSPVDVWAVGFDPGPVTVQVTGGANARRRIVHYNLVRSMERAGRWSGPSIYFERPRCTPQCAAIVQEIGGGRILAAATTAPQVATP